MSDSNEHGTDEFLDALSSALDSLAAAVDTWSPKLQEIENAIGEIAGVFEENSSNAHDMLTLEDMLTERKLADAARAAAKIRVEIEIVPSDEEHRDAAAQTASEWAEILLDELRDYCDRLATE